MEVFLFHAASLILHLKKEQATTDPDAKNEFDYISDKTYPGDKLQDVLMPLVTFEEYPIQIDSCNVSGDGSASEDTNGSEHKTKILKSNK
jgi:hypothetical protein